MTRIRTKFELHNLQLKFIIKLYISQLELKLPEAGRGSTTVHISVYAEFAIC